MPRPTAHNRIGLTLGTFSDAGQTRVQALRPFWQTCRTARCELRTIPSARSQAPPEAEGTARERTRVPPRPAPGRPAGARARGARPVAREPHLREVARGGRRPPAVDLLRGSADRQRPARHPPRRGPGLQGRLPALQDDAGLPRRAEGRLGLPRAAGRARRREGARLRRQERHRGLRHRRVQRPVPRVRAAPRRRLRGDDRADGLLGRHRPPLPHHGAGLRRVGVVGAQADPRQGPAGRGLPRRAVLPALRHRALRPRAGAGLRDGHRPQRLRAVPADLRSVRRARRPARVDHHAVDAGVEHRRRRAPRRDLRRGRQRHRDARRGRAAVRGGARRGLDRRRTGSRAGTWSAGPTSGPSSSSSSRPATGPHFVVLADYVTTEDGTGLVHQSPAFGEDDMAVGRAYGLPVVVPVRPDGHFEDDIALVGGQFFKHADADLVDRPRGPRPAVPARRLRAQLPALLALPHAADVLRAAVLVRPHHRRSRTRCCGRTRRPPGSPTPSSGAATATGCTTTSTGRCRAAATGARRCRSGGATRATRPASARSPSCPS